MRRIVLASTSPFRKELLARLQLPFDTASPEVDETRHPDEPPAAMVTRLAEAKARAVADRFPDALIIGSDQCAVLGEEILGKPGTHEAAARQLLASSGQRVVFHTGLCLLDSNTGETQIDDILYTVHFRQLTEGQIEGYLQKEQPYNCAGSFKAEGLGAALFQRMEGDDPSSLIGLPLIRLAAMLRAAGVDVLAV